MNQPEHMHFIGEEELDLGGGARVKIEYVKNTRLHGFEYVGHFSIKTKTSFTSDRFTSEGVFASQELAAADAAKKILEMKIKHGLK